MLILYKINILFFIIVVLIKKCGKWTHYTISAGQSNSYLYVNGILIMLLAELSASSIRTIERRTNFIRRSAWHDDEISFFDGELDDLKIFNRQLTIEEIVEEKENEIVSFQLLHIFTSLKLFTEGLVHYWPMAGSTNDIVGSKHMAIKEIGYLTTDRFGNKQSGMLI